MDQKKNNATLLRELLKKSRNKQLLTLEQASIYASAIYERVTKETIRIWQRKGLLEEYEQYGTILVDPDELDLLLEFRENTMTDWMFKWSIERNKDSVIQQIVESKIPTFAKDDSSRLAMNWYRRRDNEAVKIQALEIHHQFRIISDTYAAKSPLNGGYIVRIRKDGKIYLRYMPKYEFIKVFVPIDYEEKEVNVSQQEKEYEIIAYIEDHPNFAEKIKKLLFYEDELAIKLVDAMKEEKE